MALIKCPECGQEVSDRAKVCVRCGCPLKSKQLSKTRRIVLIGLLAFLVICIAGGVMLWGGAPSDNPPNEANSEIKDSTEKDAKQEKELLDDIDSLIVKSKENIQPYLEVMGADITNGNPPVSQEFIDNLDSVEIMGYIGSVEHGYNIYGSKTYIELLTWTTNETVSENDFFEFIELMNDYFDSDAVLASYDYIDDEIYGWISPEKQYSIITYFDNETIFLQWDVRLTFEDEETLNVKVTPDVDLSQTSGDKCEECGKAATKTVNLFGETEYYCATHYNEIMDIVNMMEADVGQGSASKHTCEECSNEGTHSIIGISGKTEYYCTKHYNELKEMIDMLE